MLKTYIEQKQKKLQQKQADFYTPDGLHVYFKEPMHNPVDVEKVIQRAEDIIPRHLRSEVEMVIVGWFEEFEKRSINAFYKDGALYISNVQDDEQDMFDDVVHEIAHSLESTYGYELYGDQKIKEEFLRKRKHLHDILWATGFKAPKSLSKVSPKLYEKLAMLQKPEKLDNT